ncbi:uncharacterized protein LOC131625566 [Vicia villosa]|uniref:uncharacterized protein LOC131625566 n=1 Tax=Vicia villosa TaxID=3911 RepID=UPI00273B0A05|nr:uncharacterized protein LOC131625566 [Vicia villosa]
MKGKDVMECEAGTSWSWVIKHILKQKDLAIQHHSVWTKAEQRRNFSMRNMYIAMLQEDQDVVWKGLVQGNHARPRAVLMLWMLCHGKIATKDRLCRFGIITDRLCSMCKTDDETINHVFFECRITNQIWKDVMDWLQINRQPRGWTEEVNWMIESTKKKGWRAYLLKIACVESVYGIWHHRNENVFDRNNSISITQDIIDKITYMGWMNQKYRKHVAVLMT